MTCVLDVPCATLRQLTREDDLFSATLIMFTHLAYDEIAGRQSVMEDCTVHGGGSGGWLWKPRSTPLPHDGRVVCLVVSPDYNESPLPFGRGREN